MVRVSVLRTLFLNPPSFQGWHGGAGSPSQARREIRSFWSPTWLAQPAALVPGSRLVDAPPADLTLADVLPLAREYELAVLHTSAPSFAHDVKRSEEHTSELQSHLNLVCRLLLEKKKKKYTHKNPIQQPLSSHLVPTIPCYI